LLLIRLGDCSFPLALLNFLIWLYYLLYLTCVTISCEFSCETLVCIYFSHGVSSTQAEREGLSSDHDPLERCDVVCGGGVKDGNCNLHPADPTARYRSVGGTPSPNSFVQPPFRGDNQLLVHHSYLYPPLAIESIPRMGGDEVCSHSYPISSHCYPSVTEQTYSHQCDFPNSPPDPRAMHLYETPPRLS